MFSIRLLPPEQPIIRPHKKLSHEDLRANLFSTTAAVVAMTANSAAGSLEPEGCWDCWSSSPDCGAMPPPPPPPLKITEIFPLPAEPLPLGLLGLLGLGLLLGLWGRYGVFSAGAAEVAVDGEGTSEEEAAPAPLLSWPSEEPPRNTPERHLWRDCLGLQESLRGNYLLPDPPFRQQVVVAPGTLDLFPTALRLRHFSQPLTPRQRRLLRCHNPLFSRRCLRFSPPSRGDRNLMNPWRVANRVLENTWEFWASSCCWRRLKEAGEGPERVKLRRAALRQDYCFWSHLYGRRSLEDRLMYQQFKYRPPPEPRRVPRGPRGRQRREQATKRKLLLARRLAAARLRLLLRRLVFHLGSLRSLEQDEGVDGRVHHRLVQWLQRLEAYDASADPLRTYFRSWQKPIWWQRVLLLRKAGWELRQLGQLLPPLRRSLVAPGAHSEGFRLLADTLDVFDKDQLRWLVEEEARRLAEEVESAEEVAPESPEKGAEEAAEPVVGHHPLVRYSRAFLKKLRRRLRRK